MAAIVEKNEHSTEVPTILTDFTPKNDSETNDFVVEDDYDYIDYTLNYESDHEELSEQKEIASTEEENANGTIATSNDEGQLSISSAPSSDDVSNKRIINEETEIIISST